ncbi:MBG domain-containing protein [Paraflavitalea soli]|nr:MBG domain-containing protein [Paraflavitalea soli]
MRLKLTLLFLLFCATTCVHAQPRKWYWVGGYGSASTSIQTVSNWNSKLGGGTGGTVHPGANNAATSITKGDTLVIDGSNIGFGVVAGTDTIRIPIFTQNEPARIHIINGARVLFHKSTATGTNTLTITPTDPNGSSDGKDIYIDTTSGLNIRHNGLGTGAAVLSLNVKARALIEGNLAITGGVNNRLAVPAGGMIPAVRFAPGSTFRTAVISASAFNNAGAAGSVLFEPGSTLIYDGSYSPEGNSSTVQLLTFMPGSNYIINSSTTGQPGSFFNSKSYGNVIVGDGVKTVTVPAGGSVQIDTLIVRTGSTFTINGSTPTTIKGNLTVDGTLAAAGTQTITFGGNGVRQVVAGNGAITFPNLTVSPAAWVALARNITVTTSAAISGRINFGTFQLTDNGATTATFTTTAGAVLQTANTNGFDPITGSVKMQGSKTYAPRTSYIIDAPTATPFGISTLPDPTPLTVGYLKLNASGQVTTNTSIQIADSLVMQSGLLNIRTSESVELAAGASLKGSNYGPANYIITNVDKTSGAQAIFAYKGIAAPTVVPIGSAANYLPVTFRPDGPVDVTMTVFEGVTDNAAPNGLSLPAAALDTMVNAVWKINRTAGTANCDIALQWTAGLEGTSFKTLALSNIGISSLDANLPAWQTPLGTGLANRTARAILNDLSPLVVTKFAAGMQQVIFDPLPVKTYGDAIFDPAAITNTPAVPITYSSDNQQVAVVSAGKLQIVGAGTATITASQAGATSRTQALTINKALLTIKANDSTMRPNNPITGFSFTYSGFKYADGPAQLTTLPVATSDATVNSPEGVYSLIPGNAQSPNYTFQYVNGVLRLAKDPQSITFASVADKLYGDADFDPGAVASSNLPVRYTSSNPAVAITVDDDRKVRVIGIGITTITASQPGDVSYTTAVSIPRTLRVNKAPLIIQPGDTTKVQGQPNPEFKTIKYTGFVNGEDPSVLTRLPILSTTAVLTSFAGNYPIIASQATAVNYNIVFVPGTLKVSPIDESKDTRQLQAYSNSRNTVRVQIKVTVPGWANILLYDLQGKLVARQKVRLNHAQGVNDFDIPVHYMDPGIYSVQVIGEGWKLQKNIAILP